jgi:hypothetical protein
MLKIRRTAASVIGALLVLGVCGVAAAQTSGQHPTTGMDEPKQAHFDREKVTLKDQVQSAITAADSHIDALKKMESTDKDAALKRDKDVETKLSDLRDGLKGDLDKIDKATPSDFASVRSGVESDLKKIHSEIKTAANVTHVAPTKGAAQKQAPNKK